MVIALSIILLLLGAQITYHLWDIVYGRGNYENSLESSRYYKPPVKKTKSFDEKIDDLEEIKPVKLEDGTIISSKNKIEL